MATTAIQMNDGSTKEFGEKAKVIKESTVHHDGSIGVKFHFRNGEVKQFHMPHDHQLYARAAQHGLDQKFGDAFSGIDDVEDAALAFDKVADQIKAGDWNKGRVSDGMAGTSVLAKALVKVTGNSIEEVKETLKTLEPAQKAALRKQPAIATAIMEIESAKGSKGKVDVDEVLSRFSKAA